MPPKSKPKIKKVEKKARMEPRRKTQAPRSLPHAPPRISAPRAPPSSLEGKGAIMRRIPALFPSVAPGSTDGGVPAGYISRPKPYCTMMGDFSNSVRIKVLEPFCYLGIGSTTYSYPPYAPAIIMASSVDGSSVGFRAATSVALNPFRLPFYTTPGAAPSTWFTGFCFPMAAFSQIFSQAFSEFQVSGRMVLHYQPICPTSDLSNFSLIVAPDGAHPLVGVTGNAYLDFPTFSTCEVGPNSITFAGWEPWSAEFVIDNAKKFMYQVPVYGGPGTALFPEPDTRDCSFGSMSCAFSGLPGSSGGSVAKGLLYWEVDLLLSGPVPIGNTVSDLSLEKPYTTFASAYSTLSVPTSVASASTADRWVRLPDDDTSPSPSPQKEERKASRK
jgi:hypothetical protein